MLASIAAVDIVTKDDVSVSKELTTEQTLRASVSELVLDAHKAAASGPVSSSLPVANDEHLEQILQLHDSLGATGVISSTGKDGTSPTPHGGRKGVELANAKRQDQEILEANAA